MECFCTAEARRPARGLAVVELSLSLGGQREGERERERERGGRVRESGVDAVCAVAERRGSSRPTHRSRLEEMLQGCEGLGFRCCKLDA